MENIRILLWDAEGVLQYDTCENGPDYQGDFPDETECTASLRTSLDSGNFQIRARGIPEGPR